MPRAKTGNITRKRHKKVLKAAKGYFGSKSTIYKTANEQVMKSLSYAYRDRKQRKRDFRRLWITRINAAVRNCDETMSYSKFMNGLKNSNIDINRKMLSQIAIEDPKEFCALVDLAKKTLESGKKAEPKKVESKKVTTTKAAPKKEEPKKEEPKKEEPKKEEPVKEEPKKEEPKKEEVNEALKERYEAFKKAREERRRKEEELRQQELAAVEKEDETAKAEVAEREQHRPFAIICRDAILQHDHEYVDDFCHKYGHKPGDKGVNAKVVDDILKEHGDLKNDPRWAQSKLISKTIHVDSKGKVKQAMSFPSFDPSALVAQNWENSDLRKFFKRTIFLLSIMREDENGQCFLEDVRIWHMPNNVLKHQVKDTWEDTVSRFKEGNVFAVDAKGKEKQVLPGATFNGVVSVAAHAVSKTDTIALPTKDNATGKEDITKQSFWITKKFLQDTIDHGHAYHLNEKFGAAITNTKDAEVAKHEAKNDTEVPEAHDVDLSKLTATQLKEIAKDKGLSGYSKMKKDELIDLIKKG